MIKKITLVRGFENKEKGKELEQLTQRVVKKVIEEKTAREEKRIILESVGALINDFTAEERKEILKLAYGTFERIAEKTERAVLNGLTWEEYKNV